MRIVCWQTILMKYHTLFFWKLEKMSQNLLSAAVVIGALRVNEYCEYFKILNTFPFLLVIRAGTDYMMVRKANRENPDQTASSEAVWSGSVLFVKAFVGNFRTYTLF